MEENHRPAGNIVNGPLRASADLTAIAVMKNAKKMKLEKVMLPAMISGGQRVEVEGYKGTDSDGNVTRCICGFVHDDGYMICCDRCSVWQHVLCVGVDPNDPPENYLCDKCDSRPLDFGRAVALQRRKLEEMADLGSTNSDESADESGSVSPPDFSSKLCEAVVHDHLSSTCLAPFATSGGLPRAKQRVRKPSLSKSLLLQKAHSWDSQSLPSLLDSTRLQTVNFGETNEKGIVDVNCSSHNPVTTDPWDCQSVLWCDNKKPIPGNVYTKEILEIIEIVLGNKIVMDWPLDPPQTDAVECVQRVEAKRRSLVSLTSVDANTFLHEYQGRFLTQSSFDIEHGSIPWQNSLCPYVLFFKLGNLNLNLCVDARVNGNVSRYVRRSCSPNAKVRCYIRDGKLQVGIFSQRYITSGTEITIPFDFNIHECNIMLECSCGLSTCPVLAANQATTQRLETLPLLLGGSGVRSALMTVGHNERDNSVYERQVMQHHLEQQIIQPGSPRKMSASGNHLRCAKRRRRRQSDGVILVRKDGEGDSDGLEFDGFEQEKKKNLTREERKLEAIMKAFEKMEKSEKRKREISSTGKSSGGASPESEEKKPTGRGRKIGQVGKKKPGKKRRSVTGLSLESLSPDSSSNLTSAPPATPVDVISPFTPPLVTTPVNAASTGSSVKLPRKKFIVNEWMNQDKMTTSAFGAFSSGIGASPSGADNAMNEVKENGTGPFSNLVMTSKGTTFESNGLTNDIQSNHSMSNGILLDYEKKDALPSYEWTNLQVSEKSSALEPQSLASTPQSEVLESALCSTPIRAVDPRKALLNSWSVCSTNQVTAEQPKVDMTSFCKKKRWLQMAKQVTVTQSVPVPVTQSMPVTQTVPSGCLNSCSSSCSDTTWTESDIATPLFDVTSSMRHVVSASVVRDSVSSVATLRSSNDLELGVGMREQGGKGVKRKKMSLLEYRNRKRDAVPKEETKNTSWHSESLNSSCTDNASAFGVTHTFHPVTNFEVANDADTQGNEQHIPQPHTPPLPPVIEPVTPEGDQSDSEEATMQSPTREADPQWEHSLRDKSQSRIDWSSNQTPSVLKPPQLPDLPPLPVTPPPPPPPEDMSDLPAIPHPWPVSQFQPGWTTHPLLTYPYPQPQTGMTFVQPPSSHPTSWTSFPHVGRTNYLTDSTQYTLGISSTGNFPSANPNGPFYH